MAVLGYVIHELLVLLGGPEPLPQFLLVAARVPPHYSAMQNLRRARNSRSADGLGCNRARLEPPRSSGKREAKLAAIHG